MIKRISEIISVFFFPRFTLKSCWHPSGNLNLYSDILLSDISFSDIIFEDISFEEKKEAILSLHPSLKIFRRDLLLHGNSLNNRDNKGWSVLPNRRKHDRFVSSPQVCGSNYPTEKNMTGNWFVIIQQVCGSITVSHNTGINVVQREI